MEAFIEEYLSPDKILITVAVLATLLLFLVSILAGVSIRRRARDAIDRCRYRPRKHLMVGAERSCFQLLNNLFGQRFYIIPGVALSSLLSHKVGLQDRHAAYGLIKDRSVDFVLCNQRTLRPICAVKLEDEKSKKPDKTPGASPEDMEKFFKSAHIPFVYIENPQRLTRDRVIEEFSRVIYETSIMKPLPRGRRKRTAEDTPATYKTRQKKSTPVDEETINNSSTTKLTNANKSTAEIPANITTSETSSKKSSSKSSTNKSSTAKSAEKSPRKPKSKPLHPAYTYSYSSNGYDDFSFEDYEDDLSDEELEKYFE